MRHNDHCWLSACGSRSGSSLILTMGFIIAAAVALTLTLEIVDQQHRSVDQAHFQTVALSAVDSVLTRREADLVRRAELGDVEQFQDMHNNYGEERLGDCLVRWKIEPAYLREAEPTNSAGVYDANGYRRLLYNPPGDKMVRTVLASEDFAVRNDFNYIYRLSGEARYLDDQSAWTPTDLDELRSRVQAVRYVSINRQPLLSYAIFYAQEGPKGDLEFEHGPGLHVQGSIQCNGSIYAGGAHAINNWANLNIGATRGATRMGPDGDGQSIRVNGAYGIFRLSKALLFSAFNNDAEDWGLLGSHSFNPDLGYDYTEVGILGEIGAEPPYPAPVGSASNAYAATHAGSIINPNRLKPSVTLPLTSAAGGRNAGVPVGGVWINDNKLIGGTNDSLNEDWSTQSMQAAMPVSYASPNEDDTTLDDGFSGQARTAVNGGSVINLQERWRRRPFESQQLLYEDLDGNPVTDEHAYARPLFYHPATPSSPARSSVEMPSLSNPTVPLSSDRVIEMPGTYLGYALGEGLDRYLARRLPDLTGWDVVDGLGNYVASGTPAASRVGLIIRERIIPDMTYLPPSVEPTPSTDPNYMPYAYGKNYGRQLMPFQLVSVSAKMGRDTGAETGSNSNPWQSNNDRLEAWDHWDRTRTEADYTRGGEMHLQAAMYAGPDDGGLGGATDLDGYQNTTEGRRVYPHYFRGNWQLAGLKRPMGPASLTGAVAGLAVTAYRGQNFDEGIRFAGLYSALVTQMGWGTINAALNLTTTRLQQLFGAGDLANNTSVRATGMLIAPETGPYRFWIQGRGYARIWLDGRLIFNGWGNAGGSEGTIGNPPVADSAHVEVVQLQENSMYPMVVEYASHTNSNRACGLHWAKPSDPTGNALVPASAFVQPSDNGTFDRREVSEVIVRIADLPSTNALGTKVGLMIRGEDPGDSFGEMPDAPYSLPGTPVIFLDGCMRDNPNIARDRAATIGRANDATLHNARYDGRGGIEFDGDGDYALCANPGDVVALSRQQRSVHITFSTFASLPTSDPNKVEILYAEGNSTGGLSLYLVDRVPEFAVWNGPGPGNLYTVRASAALPGATSVSAVFSADTLGGTLRLYTAGVLQVGTTFPGLAGLLPSGSSPLISIGGAPPSGTFRTRFSDDHEGAWLAATIDELVVHAEALASSSIASMHDNTLGEQAVSLGSVLPGLLQDGRAPYLALLAMQRKANAADPLSTFIGAEFRGQRAETRKRWISTHFVGHHNDGAPADAGNRFGETSASPFDAAYQRKVELKVEKIPRVADPAVWDADGDNARMPMTHEFQIPTAHAYDIPGESKKLVVYGGKFHTRKISRKAGTPRARVSESWTFTLPTADLKDYDANETQLFRPSPITYGGVQFDDDYWSEFSVFKDAVGVVDGYILEKLRLGDAGQRRVNIAPTVITMTWSTTVTDDTKRVIVPFDETERVDLRTKLTDSAYSPSSFYDPYIEDKNGGEDPDTSGGKLFEDALLTEGTIYIMPSTAYGPNYRGPSYFDGSSHSLPPYITSTITAADIDAFVTELKNCGFKPSGMSSDLADRIQIIAGLDDFYPANSDVQTAAWPPPGPVPAVDTSAAVLSVPASLATGDYTFALQRSQFFATEVNSYVSATGAASWAANNVPHTMPWGATGALTAGGLPVSVQPPLTGSLRPDIWYGTSDAWPTDPPSSAGTDGTTGTTPLDPIAAHDGVKRPTWQTWKDDKALSPASGESIWLRMTSDTSGDAWELWYATGSSSTSPSVWQQVKDVNDNGVTFSLETFSPRVELSLCLQGADRTIVSDVTFDDIEVKYRSGHSDAAPKRDDDNEDNVYNYKDWEDMEPSPYSWTDRYLASQYQVFWGPYDITEAAFTYRDASAEPVFKETWMYNSREYYSQHFLWRSGIAKDALLTTAGAVRDNRQLLAKQTVLEVNMRALQNFIRTVSLPLARGNWLVDATDASRLGGDSTKVKGLLPVSSGSVLGTLPTGDVPLQDSFNGLVYAARTNRYPWNPNRDATATDGANPFLYPLDVPNRTSAYQSTAAVRSHEFMAALAPSVRASTYATAEAFLAEANQGFDNSGRIDAPFASSHLHEDNDSTIASSSLSTNFQHLAILQPYDGDYPGTARLYPALHPTEFHHAVRLTNADSIDWDLPLSAGSGSSLDPSGGDIELGTSKTAFVTPNQLQVKGSVNQRRYDAVRGTEDLADRVTPFMIAGDSLTVLSSAWNDAWWQAELLHANAAGAISGPGALARIVSTSLPTVSASVELNCSLITNNQPTSKESVRNGEAASIITVQQFLESWSGKSMTFNGSLVVVDSRRYTDAYQLAGSKNYGRGPFGLMGWHAGKDWHGEGDAVTADAVADELAPSTTAMVLAPWTGSLPQLYVAPQRNYLYNSDLTTEAGTPPFVPFGVTSTGTGGYVTIIK